MKYLVNKGWRIDVSAEEKRVFRPAIMRLLLLEQPQVRHHLACVTIVALTSRSTVAREALCAPHCARIYQRRSVALVRIHSLLVRLDPIDKLTLPVHKGGEHAAARTRHYT